jgi:branched-chain amino acid transport system permease protein
VARVARKARKAAPAADMGLRPAPPVGLRGAVRVGIFGGLGLVFLSAVGMVERFQAREIIGPLSLGYLLLVLLAWTIGYVAGRPPPPLEGFAPARPGRRNIVAGLVAGALAGAVLALFGALAGGVNMRPVFTNVSPELVRLLTFGRGIALGGLLLFAGTALVGGTGAALHLVVWRWRRVILGAVLWLVVLGMLQSVVLQVFRGLGACGASQAAGLCRVVYEPQGLSAWGVLTVGALAATLYWVEGRSERTIRTRIKEAPMGRRRVLVLGGVAVALLVLGALPHVLGRFLSDVLNIAGIFMIMALGLNIVVGLAGLLDLGYVAFFAVGAYAGAKLTSPIAPGFAPELSFWAAIPVVIVASVAAGLIVGTPVLRMRGDYLAIVTLGFGEIARLLAQSDWLKPVVGGARGIRQVPNISFFGVEIQGPQAFFYAILGIVLLAAYGSYALQSSRVGRAWMAIREDEVVAEAMGVNIVTAKLSAFTAGAVLAGLAGALFASKIGSVFPASFEIVVSLTVLVIVIVGGLASVSGVVLGALVLMGLPELLREFELYRFLVYGALLVFMMLKRPQGFIPSKRREQELREEELMQDAWLRQQADERPEAAATGSAGEPGAPRGREG